MGEWLWWVFSSLCGMFHVIQLIGVCWLLIELRRRKWHFVPELRGIDWLDIVYRLQREFGVTITAGNFNGWPAEARAALRAGQLWVLVCTKLSDTGAERPKDGWERVVAALSEALNVKPGQVTLESRLSLDLGLMYGLWRLAE